MLITLLAFSVQSVGAETLELKRTTTSQSSVGHLYSDKLQQKLKIDNDREVIIHNKLRVEIAGDGGTTIITQYGHVFEGHSTKEEIKAWYRHDEGGGSQLIIDRYDGKFEWETIMPATHEKLNDDDFLRTDSYGTCISRTEPKF